MHDKNGTPLSIGEQGSSGDENAKDSLLSTVTATGIRSLMMSAQRQALLTIRGRARQGRARSVYLRLYE